MSDLHLFARRSIGRELMSDLLPDLKRIQVLVLNGDIVDFRWSTLANHAETLRHSIDWLEGLAASLSGCCQIHYVLGNHDCLKEFKPALTKLAGRHAGFHWHEFSLQRDGLLFVHGDCLHWRGTGSYRDEWSRSGQRGRLATDTYRLLDRLGVTRAVHRWHFPVDRTLDRLTRHLDEAHEGWRQTVRHCYFGHTHEPFENVGRDGVVFHNTGSAIRGMKFNPLAVSLDIRSAGSEQTRASA